jgi:hypothetical protein
VGKGIAVLASGTENHAIAGTPPSVAASRAGEPGDAGRTTDYRIRIVR